ncbi:MAG: bifunctional DNA primase/polymerase [Pirellulales bacterium]
MYVLRWGMALVPVAPRTKVPPRGTSRKARQQSPADVETVLGWLCNGMGVAVELGEASGGICCRDFDQPESYAAWANSHKHLAATLPTVRTGRGFHVFFRCDQAAFVAATERKKVLKMADGELRFTGCIAVLPPSPHKSGKRYTWTRPLPDEIPKVNLETADLAVDFSSQNDSILRAENRRRSNDFTQVTPSNTKQLHRKNKASQQANAMSSAGTAIAARKPPCSLLDDEEIRQLLDDDEDGAWAVVDAIEATVPKCEGQRNRRIFDYARVLLGIGPLEGCSAVELVPLLRLWFERLVANVGERDWDEALCDFLRAVEVIEHPAGQTGLFAIWRSIESYPTPRVVDRLPCSDCPWMRPLVTLCSQLQFSAGDKSFPLSGDIVGQLFDVTRQRGWQYLKILCSSGVLRKTRSGTKRGEANEYRFVDSDA